MEGTDAFSDVMNNPLFNKEGSSPTNSQGEVAKMTTHTEGKELKVTKGSANPEQTASVKRFAKRTITKLGSREASRQHYTSNAGKIKNQIKELNSQLQEASQKVSEKKQTTRDSNAYKDLSNEIASLKSEIAQMHKNLQGNHHPELFQKQDELGPLLEEQKEIRFQVEEKKTELGQLMSNPNASGTQLAKQDSLWAEIMSLEQKQSAVSEKITSVNNEIAQIQTVLNPQLLGKQDQLANRLVERREMINQSIQPERENWKEVQKDLKTLRKGLKGTALERSSVVKKMKKSERQINKLFKAPKLDI